MRSVAASWVAICLSLAACSALAVPITGPQAEERPASAGTLLLQSIQASGLLPRSAVDTSRPQVARWRPPSGSANTLSGGRTTSATLSEGDAVMGSDLARQRLGITGAGIMVGVLSDSINQVGGGIAASVASGDLPAGVVVLKDYTGSDATDEGRAMSEIVHDIAPGASLAFYTAFDGENDFANGIRALAAAGCKVIVDDVGYFHEPYFQDGVVARAVADVVASGVAYFSAAGNSSDNSYAAPYRDDYADLGPTDYPGLWGGGGHDFDPGPALDPLQRFTVQPGGSLISALQWTQPYGAATTDLDMALWTAGHAGDLSDNDHDGYFDYLWDYSLAANIGDDPFEAVGMDNYLSSAVQLDLEIAWAGGDWVGFDLKQVFYGYAFSIDEYDTHSPTIVGHPAAPGGVAVGAVPWYSPASVEPFSSRGPTDIRFDPDGNPAPETRQTPLVAAPDGVSTSMAYFDPFYGTSAAAPHAAAVAALMRGINPFLTPAEISAILASTAIDLAPAGFDNASGHGLIDAYAAVLQSTCYVDTANAPGVSASWLVSDGTLYGPGGFGTQGMGIPGSAFPVLAIDRTMDVTLNGVPGPGGFVTIEAFYTDAEIAALGITEATLRLYAWSDAEASWKLAGGVPEPQADWFVLGPPGTHGLGYYGLDTANNVVWGNVDRASTWGLGGNAIPEPTTLALLGLGLLAALRRRRRR